MHREQYPGCPQLPLQLPFFLAPGHAGGNCFRRALRTHKLMHMLQGWWSKEANHWQLGAKTLRQCKLFTVVFPDIHTEAKLPFLCQGLQILDIKTASRPGSVE